MDREFNGTIYVLGVFIGAVAALLTAFHQMGWFSKSQSTTISIEPENPTIETPKVPKISSDPTPQLKTPETPKINSDSTPQLKTPETPKINSDSTPQLKTPETPKINSDSNVRSQQKNIFPKRTNLNTVKVDDLTATMQGCQRVDKQLLCSVLLTDTKESNNLIVFNNYQRYDSYPRERIRILDFDGNEYTSEKVKVGDVEGEYFVKSQTIEDVGIRIIASFPEVPPETTKLAAIAIPLKLSHNYHTDRNVIRIHLQNIDISQ